MNPIRTLARPMLASMFVLGGLESLRDPAPEARAAKDVTDPLAEAAGDVLPPERAAMVEGLDAEQLVRANGAVQVLGGVMLATGKMPRLASVVLAGSLVPTTLAGHRFWEEQDDAARTNQMIHFFKNVSMLGGLLLAAFDREGQPSAAWRMGHAKEHVGIRGRHARREARLAARAAKAEAKATAVAARTGTVAKAAEARTAAKMAGAGAGLAAAAGTAKAKKAAAEARKSAAVAAQRAKDEARHHRRTAGTRRELVKEKLTPDVLDAKRLVGALRS